MKEIASMINN